ncbi:MAG: glycoside hydrolase family 88 protein [Kiritimatiellae bacterium]|nr:glycoside hydrolase family 88 protein [Kiritimatiellia bacterium]
MKRILMGCGALIAACFTAGCVPSTAGTEEKACAVSPARAAYDANIVAGMKTPATSKLFVKHVDPRSGVVSYLLKPGLVAFNQQSLYFTAKSMTDDGRFLVFWASGDEYPPEKLGKRVGQTKRHMVVDFLKDEVIDLGKCGGIPWIDTVSDQMWYTDDEGVHRRDFLVDPKKDNILCPWPKELGKRHGTHITLSPDRKLVFLDTQYPNGQDVEGVIDVTTGKFIEWAQSNFCCNHGQFHPFDPTLAMCAWENARYKVKDEMFPDEFAKVKAYKGLYVSDLIRSTDDVYPRLWLFRKGKKWEITSKITGYATHEYFAEDGKGFYWCSGGVSYHDLATGREWRINPIGSAHAAMSPDNKYIASDQSWGGWWRGCGSTVRFCNRETHRGVYLHTAIPRICSKERESSLHPDPHPQIVCDSRYVVCTMSDADRHMNVSVTPMDQLIAITSDPKTAPQPKTFELAYDPSKRTEATYEMEIDVAQLRARKYVSEPGCSAASDSYTAFALKGIVNGKEQPIAFEAVQGSDFTKNVVLRFKIPQGTTKLFCVADAPGRFEYYDSESCANLLWKAYDPENAGKWQLAKDVKTEEHRGGLVLTGTGTASYEVALPTEAAGRDFKFELDMRNLGMVDFTGGLAIVQLDAAGKSLGDGLAGQGEKVTIKRDRRGIYRLTGTFAKNAKAVRFIVNLKAADGKAAKALICRLNLREATVFAYTPPVEVTMATPETSKLFIKRTDPVTKIDSYVLKPGLLDDTQQSWYFTAKSMTDDGRFLFFWTAKNENKKQEPKRTAYVDFLTDTAKFIDVPPQIPWLDVKTDKIYYVRRNPDCICMRDMLADPEKEIVLTKMPERFTRPGVKVHGYHTHLTLNSDRTKAFLDVSLTENGKKVYEEGFVNFKTGQWEKWSQAPFMCNHAQICPTDDNLALCAWECCWLKDVIVTNKDGKVETKQVSRPQTEVYPRLWLFRPGEQRQNIAPEEFNYATHEHWQEDGKAIMWCCGNGFYGYNVASGQQYCISPFAAGHGAMTADNRYCVYDYPVGGWYRGCNWQVLFYDRWTGKVCFPHYKNDRLCEKDDKWHNHPDPHPQFVCNDRYIISTQNMKDGHMDLSVTPVASLKSKTTMSPSPMDYFRGDHREYWFDALPANANPMTVGAMITRQFLSADPANYFPKGASRLHAKNYVPYAVVSTWLNALDYANLTKNAYYLAQLQGRFAQFRGPRKAMCSKADHVDFSIFGSVPMAIARLGGDPKLRDFGLSYADKQWAKPNGPEDVRISKNEMDIPYDERLKYFEKGYTPQTRLWIDDMYMINVLQSQAYLLTKDRKYIDRAAKEMCLYLDKLQLKKGPAKGLFYHAPDVPFVWGRGDGWMAGGMALLLKYLPEDSEYRSRIMKGYLEMMAALLKFQRADGMWGQLVDEPSSWAESSGTAMFTSAFITGVRWGWLPSSSYGPAARRAWLALCSRIDRWGNISDVCVGTGKKNDHQYYLDRPSLNGDPHGQAPMLWCVNAMLEPAPKNPKSK